MTPEEIAKYYEAGTLGSFSTALNAVGLQDPGNSDNLSATFNDSDELILNYNSWTAGTTAITALPTVAVASVTDIFQDVNLSDSSTYTTGTISGSTITFDNIPTTTSEMFITLGVPAGLGTTYYTFDVTKD